MKHPSSLRFLRLPYLLFLYLLWTKEATLGMKNKLISDKKQFIF